ncbi:MAG: radical SAM protein [Bacteroidota bacterium]|nr:radical SAM protein [Bacteroidota bacterium]
MERIRNRIGMARTLFNTYLKAAVFLHFAREVAARRIPLAGFFGFLDRLLYFLAKMKHNKYVTTGNGTKVNLYVPAFPSPAFYKACAKVRTVGSKQPAISVLISVTSGCRFRCEHCYQKHDLGKDVPLHDLIDVVRRLDTMGVAFFNIEGGDPFLAYDRLKAVCGAVTTGEIFVNSTGDGITVARLRELRTLGVRAIMFSLHSPDPAQLNRFMGRDDAWDILMEGIARCHEAGVDVAVNTCLLRDAFYDGTFERIMTLTRYLGVSIVQLIKPKPSGAWLGSDLAEFTREDLDHVEAMVHRFNNDRNMIEYPFVAAQIHDERSDMFGCTAGGTDRFYINARGDVQPCEFLNISYGNIRDEAFEAIYARMRESFDIPGDHWLCEHCAEDIHRLFQESGARALPLDPATSGRVTASWDRGDVPDFYAYADVRHRRKNDADGEN